MFRKFKSYAVTGALTAVVVTFLAGSAVGAAPPGDYGDAPDDAAHHFPTLFATSNSRLSRPGVHHLAVGQECLGTSVSAEVDATDPADPDGVQNLVNTDGHDDGLIGLTFIPIAAQNMPFSGIQGGTSLMYATLVVSVPAGQPIGTRYLNVLVDTNRDQEWKNTREGKEWVLSNYPVNLAPGTSTTMTVVCDYITTSPPPRPADMWMRITLSREVIDKNIFANVGGWDGSGVFMSGETEDYLVFSESNPDIPLIPPPPGSPCPCEFSVRFQPPELMLLHDQTAYVDMVVTVKGAGCYAVVEGMSIEGFGAPISSTFDPSVTHVVQVGEVASAPTPNLGVPLGPGVNHVKVRVGPFQVHNIGITQTFAVCFDVGGYDCFGRKVFGSTECCGVIVIHPGVGIVARQATLTLDPLTPLPPGVPIPIEPVPGDPIGYVTFGAAQRSKCTINALQINDYPPGLPPANQGTTVRVTSFFDIFMEPSLDEGPELGTQITGFTLTGWTPGDLAAAGITNESQLRTGRYTMYPCSFFDVWLECSTQVGGSFNVDTDAHTLSVQNPYGFSYYSLGVVNVPVTVSGFSVE
jgi:hypothetical protein